MPFKQQSQTEIHQNPYYKVYKEKYTLPQDKTGTYFAIRGLQTVFVVPMISSNEIVLLKQYRYLLQEYSWEFPAGKIDHPETVMAAAQRELVEESGYNAKKIDSAGWFAPCNGLSDEQCYVYLASDLKQTRQELEETEEISVHVKSVDEFERMIENNEIHDGMTITSWLMTKKLRQNLK